MKENDIKSVELNNIKFYEQHYKDMDILRKTYEIKLFAQNILYCSSIRKSSFANKVCLEIGFGPGYLLEKIVKKGFKKIVSVEQSEVAVSFMQNRLNRIKADSKCDISLHLVTGCKLPSELNGELFDLIILSNVIEHIGNDKEYIKNLSKLLNKDGMLILAFPTGHMDRFKNPLHFRSYNIADFKSWFELNLPGGRVVEAHPQPPFLMGFIYVYIFTLLLSIIPKGQIVNGEKDDAIKEMNNNFSLCYKILRWLYHSFIVPGMIAFSRLDSYLATKLNYGSQGIIVFQKK